MLPITNSGSVPCNNISSNCVVWQGPDIPCIELCTGDTVSDVIAELAQKLCDISIPEVNIDAIDLLCTLPEGEIRPDTLEEIIQLIINEVCREKGVSRIDIIVPLGCLSYEDETGNEVTELLIDQFSVFIAEKICSILSSIEVIELLIQNHETRISILEGCILDEDGNCNTSTGDPEVYSSCILEGQTIAASVLLVALEQAYCNLETAVGSPPLITNAVNQAGCITSSELLLSGSGTYGSLSGWSATPNTLAEAMGNAWLVICDMHQAIKDIQLNCCPGACDSIIFDYDFDVLSDETGSPTGLSFSFASSSIPSGFIDCGGSTTISVTDQNGVLANSIFTFSNFAGTSTPFIFDISSTTLSTFGTLNASIDFCVTDGRDTCTDTVSKSITTSIPCIENIAVSDITENSAIVSFTNVLGTTAVYNITITDGSSSDVITVSNLTSSPSVPLTGLNDNTNYQITIVGTLNGQSTSIECPGISFTTEEDIAIPDCPNRRVVFQICNENSVTDDNFDILLNGTFIGSVDLNQNAQVGSVFIADADPTLTISGSDFACPIANMVQFNFAPSLLLPANTITMTNTQNNGSGNFGTVGIRNYNIVTDPVTGQQTLANPCVIADLEYSGGSGQSFTLTFNYDTCCAGDV